MVNVIDRLVCAIVHKDDADAVNEALVGRGYGVTHIDAQGGFLRRGNAVLLVGIPETAVDDVLKLIREHVQQGHGNDAHGSTYGIAFVLRAGDFARI